MTPKDLPKLTIYQPDWFEAMELRKREAAIGFRRELALKKLRSTYDPDEIDECLRLMDDDPLVGEVLRDLGLDPGVHADSLHHLFNEHYVSAEEHLLGDEYLYDEGTETDDDYDEEWIDYYSDYSEENQEPDDYLQEEEADEEEEVEEAQEAVYTDHIVPKEVLGETF